MSVARQCGRCSAIIMTWRSCAQCGGKALVLCHRCHAYRHEEHIAWEAEGIYFPGTTLDRDQRWALREVERILGIPVN